MVTFNRFACAKVCKNFSWVKFSSSRFFLFQKSVKNTYNVKCGVQAVVNNVLDDVLSKQALLRIEKISAQICFLFDLKKL